MHICYCLLPIVHLLRATLNFSPTPWYIWCMGFESKWRQFTSSPELAVALTQFLNQNITTGLDSDLYNE